MRETFWSNQKHERMPNHLCAFPKERGFANDVFELYEFPNVLLELLSKVFYTCLLCVTFMFQQCQKKWSNLANGTLVSRKTCLEDTLQVHCVFYEIIQLNISLYNGVDW